MFRFIFILSLLLFSQYAVSETLNKVTFSENNTTLKAAFEEIEKQTNLSVDYEESKIDISRKINIAITDMTVNDALNLILKNSGYTYTIKGKHIIISMQSPQQPPRQQQADNKIRISGTVTDADGEPIIGANVVERGTTNGNITDVDGKFEMEVQRGAVLVVSYIGYSPHNVTVGNQRTLNIRLSENTQALDEVVVVGYGTQKKVNLTGSVSTVRYDQELENRPITDVSQVLQGSVPGVWATQFSGNPGEDGATIRIRGYGSLGTSSNSRDPNPLILIDGIEGKMSEVDPNAIESLTVLKDAASAAIYGSRAANGVILIETKKGEAGRIRMSYNGYAGVQQLAHSPEFITNSADFMELWNEALINTGGSQLFPNDVISAFRNGTDPYKYPNTDFAKEIFKNSFITSHNLTINVGSQSSSTNLSLSYLSNDGILRNTSSERYSLTVNNETKIKDWLRIGARARLQRRENLAPGYAPESSITASGSSTNRAFYLAGFGYPFATPFLEDGKTFGATQALYLSGDLAGQPIVDTRNPFPDLYNGKASTLNNFFRGNVYATVDFTNWLHLTVNYSGQYTSNTLDVYNTPNYCYTGVDGSGYTKSLDYVTNITNSRRVNDEWYSTFFANLNFDKTFNEIHEISGVLGYQQESLNKRYTMARRMNPPKSTLHQVSAGTDNIEGEGNLYQWRMLSYFGRVNYALMSKYLFEVNLRADASSRFNPDKRWGYFPSFSTGWRLGEEQFIKNLNIFDNLKLRASWGQLGNQNTGSRNNNDYFPYLTVITQDYDRSYNYGNSFAPGAAVTALSEYNLTWETTTTTDFGLDIGVLNNRLNIEADYFYKKTSDILVSLPLPLAMGGLTPPTENIGEVENKGFEFNATWQDRSHASGLSYRISGNITYVDNVVTKFQGGKSPDQTFLIREGYSFQSLYGYVWDGIYQSDEEAAAHMKNNSIKPKKGDLRYVDVDGDNRIDNKDMQVLGNTIPKFNYGLNGSVAYKNFDLSFSFSGSAGYLSYFNNYWSQPLNTSGGTIPKRWENRWTSENPSTTLPRITINYPWNNYASSFWTADMWWVKLKNVQFGYNVPKNIVDKLKLQRLYVYLNGSNLYCWVTKDYEGFDPERDGAGSGSYHYPVPRVFTMGLNITF
ncbi:MAG: TonB-dependent receptor [Tannerellaceae bacterium]|nr:TonB-dependent receptor [Tannerellaceae bacterium]